MEKEKLYRELIKENDTLTKQLSEKEDYCARNGMSWDDMIKETNDIRLKITENDRKARQIQDPTIQFGKNWNGELIPIDKFIKGCEVGDFEDSNGVGRYATETGVSDIYIYPSDVLDNVYRKDFSHVLWLNKLQEL